ncbi:hypothetical protein OESDEN_06835 [Oesophagostomum dentatum]|uniref:Peptidase M1 membrane alanine aminopeptidase domain-containing protein n=1 Tax=Oesophagostomum dentatum TaxID=61180 RepID=A0A0B1TBQ8_OESDE|nr:hypothetical protein OESDEN_06835 [Oesophagostomum dentatum]
MRNDQMPNSLPVSRRDEAFDPETAFTSNTYKKATLIMLMVERIVGEVTFRDGLRLFLNQFMYKNVDHTDLLAVLTSVYSGSTTIGGRLAGQNFTLSEVIETWIYQQGFPILNVRKRPDGKVQITQEIYRHIPGHKRSGVQWKIPLFLRDPITLKPTVKWLVENSTAVLDLGDDIVLDREGRSFVRIRYDDELYLDIAARLHADANCIPVAARWVGPAANSLLERRVVGLRTRLMDDSFTLAETGNLSYAHALNISVYLRREKFVITILEPLFEHFRNSAMTNEEVKIHEDDLRTTVYTRVCLNGHPSCVAYAQQLLNTLRISCADSMLSNKTCNTIPPYLRQPIYSTAVMYGDDDLFEFMYSKYSVEMYQMERERIWIALGASKKKEHIHRVFDGLFFNEVPVDLRPMCAGYVT